MTRVADLVGAKLDYWVAKAQGLEAMIEKHAIMNSDPVRNMFCWLKVEGQRLPDFTKPPYRPSSDWSQGGPIIEREGGSLFRCNEEAPFWVASWWFERDGNGRPLQYKGPTALIAAMRAYVASKFGDTVPDGVPA